MSHFALQACSVTKTFPDGTCALQNINWNVKVGETMVLIGESGSGKTTLLRLLNRLDEPTSGEIQMMETNVALKNPIELRRQIGYVQQDGGLLPHWTVAQNVSLLPTLLGWKPKDCHQRVDQLLDLVGLETGQYRDRYPIALSGGQRQRVAVARALAGDPDIVLLDEPFGALDALTRIELQQQFLNLKHRLNKTMVLVTHDLQEAFYLGDRIAIMKEGRVVQIAPPQELMEQPADDYVKRLLQHLPTS